MSVVALISPDRGVEPTLSRLLAGKAQVVHLWEPAFATVDDGSAAPCAGMQAADAARAAGADVVCLGPGLADEAALRIARAIDLRYPSVSSLIIAKPSPRLWHGAIRAGVRGVLAPDRVQSEWQDLLDEALEAAGRRAAVQLSVVEQRPDRKVFVVLSPKGGTGKTTTSVNLAAALAARGQDEVALVDLDVQFGDVASSLQLTPAHTLLDVARAAGTLDATTLKVFLTAHSSGMWVLAAPTTPAEADETSAATATEAITLLSETFPVVVVDTGSGLDEHTLAAIDLATDLVFVSTMDVSSVRGLRKLLDVVDELGVTARRHVVLNRCDAKTGVGIDDVARSLGAAIDIEIPTSASLPLTANQGLTAVEHDSRSAAARKLVALGERLHPPTHVEAAAGSGGFLRRRKASA